ncbi:hypothetical protein Aau02nite_03280 [Amorphoplanes auranticolor]|uniref:Uncharacterized protein n=1 Tax=Actinoplanes auranticolor TaxID=47988 RepID=A0A919S5Q3_9ACTN|nr:hypothetical protein Aau02nite_03280 [Actinoplanes auranticolor]
MLTRWIAGGEQAASLVRIAPTHWVGSGCIDPAVALRVTARRIDLAVALRVKVRCIDLAGALRVTADVSDQRSRSARWRRCIRVSGRGPLDGEDALDQRSRPA